jgi:flagellar hook-basal body complex protein FliE
MQIDLNAVAGVAASGASSGLTAMAAPNIPAAGAGATSATSAPFSELLTDSVAQVNQLEDQAQAAVTGLMTGSGVDIHQAMIATQKASMAFELSLAVRNKAVQAYQQVMSLQF